MVELLPFAITREALARDPYNRETLNCTRLRRFSTMEQSWIKIDNFKNIVNVVVVTSQLKTSINHHPANKIIRNYNFITVYIFR